MSKGTLINCSDTVNEYINREDWRIRANSNGGYSNAGLINNIAGKVIANWWLNEIYSEEEGAAHRNGDYHIHDLDSATAYCFTEDTKIKTVDFGDITIKELLEKNITDFTVISFDGKKKVECHAYDLRCTRKDAELVEVTFDDGLKIRCTPDHKFLALTPETDPETHEAYLKVEWKPAAYLTMRTVRKAYTCPIIKSDVIKLEEVEGVITESDAKNSFAKVISVKPLVYKEDVYCMTVDETHCFALENGVIAHNCCGHDLQKLLQEGFNGVVSRVGAKPPKHFREALYQMANYIGILQAEWAGAQAFSSFDTLLAPYVFYDMNIEGLDERDIKKAIINFVYNLNVPSRWGQCVPASYRCLKADGTWVNYENLQIGDEIYVVDMESGLLKKDKITHLNLFDAPKKMHRYGNKSNGFNFEVTPNHRVIYKTGSNSLKIKESAELLDYDMVGIPIAPWGKHTPESFMSNEYDIQDELLELIAYIITDGTIVKQEGKQTRLSWFKSPRRFGIERFEELCDILNITYSRRKDESSKFEGSFVYEYRMNVSENTNKIVELLNGTKHEVPEFMQYLSPRQCYIILDAWVLMDGHFDGKHWSMQADNKKLQEMLAYLAIKAGKAVSLNERLIGTNKNATIYANLHKRQIRSCVVSEVEASCEKVWCPTTETGTFVCMTDEGYVFLTGNSPFSNLTIDWTVPSPLKDLVPMYNDTPYFVKVFNDSIKENYEKMIKYRGMFGPGDSNEIEFIDKVRERLNDYESDEETLMYSLTYKHFQKEMDIINRCFYQVLTEGDKDGQPFTFPIPTVNITEDFDWDNPNCKYLFENTAKYGHSYFQNFIGSQYLRDENGNLSIKDPNAYSPNDLRSMCCRLQLSKRELRKRGGGLFGSDSQTGSIGVVTINMARLGYLHKGDMEGLKNALKKLCDMAKSTLEKKRKIVQKYNDEGLYPYTRRYINTFDTFFSTIGVNGMNEMVRNFTNDKYDITDMRGQQMCKDLLDYINELILGYQEETGILYNLEASPSEGACFRMAKEDLKRFPDIIQAGYPDAPYYTNSSHLPVDFSDDPFAVLDLQDELQKKYTGGTTLHLYMTERISTPEACKQLVKKVLSNYRLPYISITPSFSVCPKHGYIAGAHDFCPLCDKEIMAKHAKEVDLNT